MPGLNLVVRLSLQGHPNTQPFQENEGATVPVGVYLQRGRLILPVRYAPTVMHRSSLNLIGEGWCGRSPGDTATHPGFCPGYCTVHVLLIATPLW